MAGKGKAFETLIKVSCEHHGIYCLRLKDAGSFVGGVNTGSGRKFTTKNPCDFVMYDNQELWLIEAKTRQTAIPFADLTQQAALLRERTKLKQLACKVGYMFRFGNDPDRVWYVPAVAIPMIEASVNKKSFNYKDLEDHEIFEVYPLEIPKGKRNPRIKLK